MILRNFLYLDNNMMEDYLSALDGYLIEERSETKTDNYANDVEGNLKILKGNMATECETTVNSKQAITYASRFQKLYELMNKNKEITYIDKINTKNWSKIQRGNILEIETNIEIAKSFCNFKAIKDAETMLEFFKTMGAINTNNRSDLEAMKAISGISNMVSINKIPIICTEMYVERYKIYANLQQKYLENDILELEGSATIIGKVQKILEVDDSDEVYNPLANYKNLIELGKANAENNETMENIIEEIKGPAIKLIPLAIYR